MSHNTSLAIITVLIAAAVGLLILPFREPYAPFSGVNSLRHNLSSTSHALTLNVSAAPSVTTSVILPTASTSATSATTTQPSIAATATPAQPTSQPTHIPWPTPSPIPPISGVGWRESAAADRPFPPAVDVLHGSRSNRQELTAVCITGKVRSFHHPVMQRQWKSYLADPLHAVPDSPTYWFGEAGLRDDPRGKEATFPATTVDAVTQRMKSLLPPGTSISVWEAPTELPKSTCTQQYSARVLSQFLAFARCASHVLSYEQEHGVKFTTLVKLRWDMMPLVPFVPPAALIGPLSSMLMPAHYPQFDATLVGDQWWMMPMSDVAKAVQVTESSFAKCAKYPSGMVETWFAAALRSADITITSTFYPFTLLKAGTRPNGTLRPLLRCGWAYLRTAGTNYRCVTLQREIDALAQ